MMRCLVAVSAFLLLSTGETSAQDMGSIRGTVVDSVSAVLPGVMVTATEIASGRQHTGVTDDRGEYRLPSVPAGTYDLRAELTGFGTVIISKVELLVGQNATIAIKM